MSLTKTKIEYLERTWPIVTGCSNNCPFCYARRIANRYGQDFAPKFHAERLNDPAKCKTPYRIGVAFTGDICSAGIDSNEHIRILEAIERGPQHVYLILTKCPEILLEDGSDIAIESPIGNAFVGTSISTPDDYHRLDALAKIAEMGWNTWVSFEPILAPMPGIPYLDTIKWATVGALTSGNQRIPTRPEKGGTSAAWVMGVMNQLNGKMRYYLKESAYRALHGNPDGLDISGMAHFQHFADGMEASR